MARSARDAHGDWSDNLAALWRDALAFAAFLARLDPAGVPLFVLCVRGAEPALATVAEDAGGFVAGFIQQGDGFADGFCLFLTKRFACRLRFHEAPR